MAGHISRRHRPQCAKRKDRRRRCNCDGPWRVRMPDPAKGGSAQIERRFPAGAKREAEAWKASQEHALQTGGWIDPHRAERPFRDVADAWKATWRDLEPKTRAGYESILSAHLLPEFGARKVSSITPEAVEAYLNRLAEEGTKPGTIRNIFAALRTALNTGVRLRMIASNPCLGVKPPKMRRQPMLFLTAAEVRALAEAIEPQHRTLVYVAAYCGLRGPDRGSPADAGGRHPRGRPEAGADPVGRRSRRTKTRAASRVRRGGRFARDRPDG